MPVHEKYMRRCFDLAMRGSGMVSPNPLVGAVLVHGERIIGEGFHARFGEAHAERKALAAVSEEDRALIPESRLYVSLEPCCHHGKTPPCTDLILESGLKEVFISMRDPNPLVCGKGVEKMHAGGVTVHEGILADKGLEVVRFFETAMTLRRPYVMLKFVQSADGFIGKPNEQVWLSNAYERIMVHKLRSEIDGILVGTNTAVVDNPRLTTRDYPGRHPLRVLIDKNARIPLTHHAFDGSTSTLVYTGSPERFSGIPNVEVSEIRFDDTLIPRMLQDLYHRGVQSLLVEGGAELISSFMKAGLWDEALVVRTTRKLESGVKAPVVSGQLKWRYEIGGDEILSMAREENA